MIQERLEAYYPFHPQVSDAVAWAAEAQNRYSFRDLARQYGIENGPGTILPDGYNKPLEMLTFIPREDYDSARMRVYHLPMGNGISPQMAMRGMRLFAADPSEQLTLVGNPSVPGSGGTCFPLKHSIEAMKQKSLTPFVEPLLGYLAATGVSSTDQIGFSYGADKAATSAREAARYDIEVPKGVFVEGVSAEKRSIVSLAKAFQASGAALAQYVEQSGSSPYVEARGKDNLAGLIKFSAGLLRVSNIAVATILAGGEYEHRIRLALEDQPQMAATLGWGTSSELVSNESMDQMTTRLQVDYGAKRITGMRLEAMHHAGENDIDLHAAIVLQGLRH